MAPRRLFFGDVFRAKTYTPKCLALFDPDQFCKELPSAWLHPSFVAAVQNGSEQQLRSLVTEHMTGVYSFPCFNPEFCDLLLAEIDNADAQRDALELDRPNGMNRYGMVLNQLGLEPLNTHMQQKFLEPLSQLLFPREGAKLDDHHTFIVRYNADEDLGLDMHEDDSDVTLNVCLGRDFEAATLSFCHLITDDEHRQEGFTYSHMKGRAVIHLGRHRHGADDITCGERVNFILWSLNSMYRASEAFEEDRRRSSTAKPPIPKCLSYTHDADYTKFVKAPSNEDALKRGVMLDHVEMRRQAQQALVLNLAAPTDAINDGPCLCVFMEAADPETQRRIAQDIVAIARTERAQAEQEKRESGFTCFAAVSLAGAVGQVRSLCRLEEIPKHPVAVILDVPNEVFYRLPEPTGDTFVPSLDGSSLQALVTGFQTKALKPQEI